MPQISDRGVALPSSPIRKLAPYAEAAEKAGVKVYHLNIGQPDLPTPQKGLGALKKLDAKTLEYSPSQGTASLRERFASYYRRLGINVTKDEVVVTTGGSEAILMVLLACLDPGDEVILTEPGYANYLSFAACAGVNVVSIPSSIENGFALPSAEDFEAAITPRTKAILLCNPNNPTGYLYTAEELFRIRDIVRKHDLFLIADEVYREFVYTGEPYISALSLYGIEQNVIVVDSVSKRYSECGIRIGMIVTHNREVYDSVLKICQARLSPPLLGQIVAEASVDGTEEYAKECYDEYLARRNFFIEGLNRILGVYSPMPQGAFYTVASLPVEDAEDFCKWCLTDFRYFEPDGDGGSEKSSSLVDSFLPVRDASPVFGGETVMMAPAAGFYSTPGLGRNQVRLAYVLNVNDLRRALVVLEAALKAYQGRENG